MFNVGDTVFLKTNYTGILRNYQMGDVGEIVSVAKVLYVEVIMVGNNEILFLSPTLIEHVTLPTGHQTPLRVSPNFQLAIDDLADWSTQQLTKKCDCGGLKVHGSLEAMFHSRWCSSQAV